LLMILADDRVGFPVADAFSLFDDLRALFD
jgi:hypothetical protein